MIALLRVLVAGVIAAATLDLWQQIFRLAFGVPITDWAMIGRWVGHFPEGQFVHKDIGKASPVAGERALGWLVHYLVGVGYAAVYLMLMTFAFGKAPSLMSALVFGAASVCVTWLVMEPMLGAGIIGARLPNQAVTMAHDFTSHLAMGLGLFIGFAVARGLALG